MNDHENQPKAAAELTAQRIAGCRTPGGTDEGKELFLDFTLHDRSYGAPLFLHRDGVYLWACGDHGRLRVPLTQAELKYFYPNPEDYYYLPMEDEAIHKSVSSFVERSHRVQAKASTCYTRRSGVFIPVFPVAQERDGAIEETLPGFPDRTPVFRVSWRDRRRFMETKLLTDAAHDEDKKEDMEHYLLHVLSYFLCGSR